MASSGLAIVPFRTLGPAADQRAEERLFQLPGSIAVTIRQQPSAAHSTKGVLKDPLAWVEWQGLTVEHRQTGSGGESTSGSHAVLGDALRGPSSADGLANVGLVAWQSGFLLAEFLLAHHPCGSWHGLCVIDLGCGTGLVGIALALAGATVTLTDLPHVLPLAALNAAANFEGHGLPAASAPETREHAWGDLSSAGMLPHADLITAADVLYHPPHYPELLDTLAHLCCAHTVVYIAWKQRHKDEEAFPGMAEARGFIVEQVPSEYLADEYRDASYVILRLCKLDGTT